MYAGGYFPSHYFSGRYFPRHGVVLSDAPYFPVGYFAPRYFADRYFPHGTAPLTIKPSYFYHGYFSAKFYTDRYFPGEFVGVIPPVPEPIFGGGQPQPFPPEVIHALVKLVLPQPVIRIRAQYLPPGFDAAVRLEWAYVLEALATASAADIRAAIQAVAPWVDVEQVMVTRLDQRRRKRQPDDEDELDAHYLASLGLYREES